VEHNQFQYSNLVLKSDNDQKARRNLYLKSPIAKILHVSFAFLARWTRQIRLVSASKKWSSDVYLCGKKNTGMNWTDNITRDWIENHAHRMAQASIPAVPMTVSRGALRGGGGPSMPCGIIEGNA